MPDILGDAEWADVLAVCNRLLGTDYTSLDSFSERQLLEVLVDLTITALDATVITCGPTDLSVW